MACGEGMMVRLKGFEKLTNVDDALASFLGALRLRRLDAESVTIEDALGRVDAEHIYAPADLPAFDRSAVDGYAVRAEETFEASQFKPKTLTLTTLNAVGKGQAKQIWTGNPLPKAANAVLMLEHTRTTKKSLEIIGSVTPGENVSKKGEDIRKGEVAVKAGTRLQPHHLGLIAALGITKINVVRKPKVAILSTGNELVELGKEPNASQIVNSNRFLIAGLCRELDSEPLYLGIVKDDENDIASSIEKGLEKADIVVTTGGTSVGAADLVPIVVSKLGKPGIIVHGVALRPGMPTALGVVKGKPVFVLSGYPVASAIGFEVFVRPTLLKLLGLSNASRPFAQARLSRRVAGALGRRVYLRVKVAWRKGEFVAEPIITKGSGLLSSLTKANGYVIIPEDREGLAEDEMVTVYFFSPVFEEEQ